MNEWFTRLNYKFADRKRLLANYQEHKKIADAVIARKKTIAINYLYPCNTKYLYPKTAVMSRGSFLRVHYFITIQLSTTHLFISPAL